MFEYNQSFWRDCFENCPFSTNQTAHGVAHRTESFYTAEYVARTTKNITNVFSRTKHLVATVFRRIQSRRRTRRTHALWRTIRIITIIIIVSHGVLCSHQRVANVFIVFGALSLKSRVASHWLSVLNRCCFWFKCNLIYVVLLRITRIIFVVQCRHFRKWVPQ